MVDTAYVVHAAKIARRTRGNIRDFVANAILRLAAADVPSAQSTILNRAINDEQEEWRGEFPTIRGMGDRTSDETWDTTKTRHELPTDFAELHPSSQGRILLLDTDGNEDTQLEVITVGAYDQNWRDGHNPYTDRQDPIAFLFGTSTNARRFIEIRPTPTEAIQFRVRYVSFVENLDADADELEAPLGMHGGIEAGVAARFAMYSGSPTNVEWRAEAERVKNQFRDPIRQETRRQGRFLPFDDPVVGGYRSLEHPE